MNATSSGPTCDKCGHAAHETWQHQTTARLLLFCTHYSREYQLALYGKGFRPHGGSHRLTRGYAPPARLGTSCRPWRANVKTNTKIIP